MFPVRFCGIWSLIACSEPTYIGSELTIDYNTIRFTPIKRYGIIKVKKNMYGSLFVQTQNKTKIAWLKTVNYDIETPILPLISIPVTHTCSKMIVSYDIDSTSNWITIQHQKNKYVFQRELVSPPKNDSILKIFLTQILFDYIIRSIHHGLN